MSRKTNGSNLSGAGSSAHQGGGIEEILAGYVERLNAGEPVDTSAVRRDHPEVADELLQHLRLFHGIEAHDRSTPERTLGDYTLRRQIGRGGMGVVYEAWQNSVDRQVALKVLPSGVAADDRAFLRFMREARTAAKLSHSNIVGVHGLCIEEDTPYYSMEYVEGETLAQILARIKHAERESETPFGPKDEVDYFAKLARCFADVVDGLQHAHSKGVTHRDIKPSNLILDTDGRLRILDFGLARLEGQESLTHSGDFVGTPLYMSPEQARRKKIPVDHRTDVYSLGATMYEAICGRPPFRGKDHADTLSQIIERDPVESRKLNPRVPKDLETIVLKCLRKAAADRYGTAEALGQDLRRFVRGDPIEARPQSSFEKFARAMHRHKAVLTASIIALVILIAGLAASTFVIWKAQGETEEALAASKRAGAETKAIIDFLVKDILGSAAPEHTLGRPLTVAEVLTNAEQKLHSLKDQPRVEAAVRRVLGDTYTKLGRYREAEAQLTTAYGTSSKAYGSGSSLALSALNSLGLVHLYQGKLEDAEREIRECIDATERLREPERYDLLVSARLNLSAVLSNQGKKREACELTRSALELHQELHGRPHVRGMRSLATMLEEHDELEKARQVFEEVIKLLEEDWGPDHPETLLARGNFALLLKKEGKLREARQLNEENLERLRKVLGAKHPFTLSSMNNLANDLQAEGNLPQARELHEQVLEVRLRDLGESHPETLGSMSNLASVLSRQGDHERSLELGERAVAVALESHGGEHHVTLRLKKDLANRLIEATGHDRSSHHLARALELLEDILRVREKSEGREHPNTLEAVFDVANVQWRSGNLEEARRGHAAVLDLRRKLLGVEHRDTLRSLNNLAIVLYELGEVEESCRVHHETLEARIRVLGGGAPDTLSSLNNWMVAHTRRWTSARTEGRWGEAVSEWREVVRRLETWALENEEVAKYREVLANAWNNLAWDLATCPDATVREPEEAVRVARKAVDVLVSDREVRELADSVARRRSGNSPLGDSWSTLGTCCCAAGKWREAVESFERAMPLRGGGDGYDWFCLALARANLGDFPEARTWYERGATWLETNTAALERDRVTFEELQRLRDEAAQALGTETKTVERRSKGTRD